MKMGGILCKTERGAIVLNQKKRPHLAFHLDQNWLHVNVLSNPNPNIQCALIWRLIRCQLSFNATLSTNYVYLTPLSYITLESTLLHHVAFEYTRSPLLYLRDNQRV